MDRVKAILDASAELRSLRERIQATVRLRDRNAQAHERWSTACREFHSRYPTLFYPGGDEALTALGECEPAAIAAAVDFIVADPMHFRSGYTKEYVWAHLLHCSLSATDINRLKGAALGYLQRRIDRSFWSMCRAMSRVAPPTFWDEVQALVNASGDPVKTRAGYLLVFKQGAAAGGQLRRQLSQEIFMRQYRERRERKGS